MVIFEISGVDYPSKPQQIVQIDDVENFKKHYVFLKNGFSKSSIWMIWWRFLGWSTPLDSKTTIKNDPTI